MKKVFIFDLDDTLMDNVHDYSQPILDATKYIIEAVGTKAPHVSKIIAMEHEIDKRRVNEVNPETGKPFLYSATRFPGTLVEVYREICRQTKVECKKGHEEKLYEIGMGAFNRERYRGTIRSWVYETLSSIYQKGDCAMLLTKGDPEVQQTKIDALFDYIADREFYLRSGVYRNEFHKVKIVESNKTTEVFAEMLKDYDPAETLVVPVGNDYDKDVVPALQLANYKVRGIWTPVESWELIGKLDEIRSKMDKERCLEFADVSEIPHRYKELA